MHWPDSFQANRRLRTANLVLQAILARDLASIELLFQRIEGGSEEDTTIQERIRI